MITNKMRREIDREVRKERRKIRKAEEAVQREARKEKRAARRAERKTNTKERQTESPATIAAGQVKRKPLFSENKVRQSLRRNKDKAVVFLKNDEKMDELLAGFEVKLKMVPRVGHRLADIPVMVAMLRSYVRREYTKVPLDTILLALAAVLYVVNPLDVVPDVLAGLGYLDDATALGIVLNAIHSDVVDFKKWQAAKKAATLETVETAEAEEIEEAAEGGDPAENSEPVKEA